MLKCKGCNYFFTLDDKACTYSFCNHTICGDCNCHTCSERSKHCIICCKENKSWNLFYIQIAQENHFIKELKTDIINVPYLGVENYIVDYQIQEINILCSIHKYPSVSYSIKKSQFVCELCKDDDKYSLTIKEIIYIKLNLLKKKKEYLSILNTIKTEFEENNNEYNKIHTLIINKTLSCNIKKELMELLLIEGDKLIKEVYSIVDNTIGNHNYKVKKLYDIYNDFIRQYKDLTNEIEKNEAICKEIRKIKYNLKDSFKMIIDFEKPVNPEKILALKEKYTEVELKLNFGIKEMLNYCISRIHKLDQAKNYDTEIESIFEKVYPTMVGNKSGNNK